MKNKTQFPITPTSWTHMSCSIPGREFEYYRCQTPRYELPSGRVVMSWMLGLNVDGTYWHLTATFRGDKRTFRAPIEVQYPSTGPISSILEAARIEVLDFNPLTAKWFRRTDYVRGWRDGPHWEPVELTDLE